MSSEFCVPFSGQSLHYKDKIKSNTRINHVGHLLLVLGTVCVESNSADQIANGIEKIDSNDIRKEKNIIDSDSN